MANLKVGKITHYYDKIGVAVIEVLGTLASGDKIKITGSNEFTQEVDSIQIEHEKIKQAKKGQVVGLKVNEAVKKGDEVFKVT